MRFGEGTLSQESALNLYVFQVVVTLDDDFPHLDFLLLIHGHVEDHLILVGHVLTLQDGNFGITVALVVEVFLSQDFRAVYHVGRNLRTFQQTEFLLHILALRLFQTEVVDGAHARAHGKMDMQVDFCVHDRVGRDGHLREQSMFPVSLHGLRDFRSRYPDLLSHIESGNRRQHIVFVSRHARHGESTDGTCTRCSGIGDVGVHDFPLCRGGHRQQVAEDEHEDHPRRPAGTNSHISFIHFHLYFSFPASSSTCFSVLPKRR